MILKKAGLTGLFAAVWSCYCRNSCDIWADDPQNFKTLLDFFGACLSAGSLALGSSGSTDPDFDRADRLVAYQGTVGALADGFAALVDCLCVHFTGYYFTASENRRPLVGRPGPCDHRHGDFRVGQNALSGCDGFIV